MQASAASPVAVAAPAPSQAAAQRPLKQSPRQLLMLRSRKRKRNWPRWNRNWPSCAIQTTNFRQAFQPEQQAAAKAQQELKELQDRFNQSTVELGTDQSFD